MGKIIITVVLTAIILLGVLLLTKERNTVDDMKVLDPERAKIIAREWITDNAATYVFDGYGLEFLESEVIKEGERYKLTFSFTSRAAGYGDRSDELAAQVITPHIIEVVVEKGKVVSAVTDGDYDEIKEAFIEPETKIIRVYFVETVEGQEKIVEAVREISFTVAVGRAAIEELLKGPFVEEKAAGLSTSIPKETKLLSIDIKDGVARVDFSKELQKGVAGSARVITIRNQIERTLKQFGSVDEVIIMVEGESEGILQP
jgi:hypothetical protein